VAAGSWLVSPSHPSTRRPSSDRAWSTTGCVLHPSGSNFRRLMLRAKQLVRSGWQVSLTRRSPASTGVGPAPRETSGGALDKYHERHQALVCQTPLLRYVWPTTSYSRAFTQLLRERAPGTQKLVHFGHSPGAYHLPYYHK
jgi:hypothetical protein